MLFDFIISRPGSPCTSRLILKALCDQSTTRGRKRTKCESSGLDHAKHNFVEGDFKHSDLEGLAKQHSWASTRAQFQSQPTINSSTWTWSLSDEIEFLARSALFFSPRAVWLWRNYCIACDSLWIFPNVLTSDNDENGEEKAQKRGGWIMIDGFVRDNDSWANNKEKASTRLSPRSIDVAVVVGLF